MKNKNILVALAFIIIAINFGSSYASDDIELLFGEYDLIEEGSTNNRTPLCHKKVNVFRSLGTYYIHLSTYERHLTGERLRGVHTFPDVNEAPQIIKKDGILVERKAVFKRNKLTETITRTTSRLFSSQKKVEINSLELNNSVLTFEQSLEIDKPYPGLEEKFYKVFCIYQKSN